MCSEECSGSSGGSVGRLEATDDEWRAETSRGMHTNGAGVGLRIYSQWLLLPVAWLVCAAVPPELCWLMAAVTEMVS